MAPIIPLGQQVTGVTIARGIPATRLSVAALPNGAHALAWIAAPSSLFGVAVDASGQALASVETLLTPTADVGAYSDATIAYVGGHLAGMVENSDATMFYKTYPANVDGNFLTADARTGVLGLPGFGEVAGVSYGVHVEAGDIIVQTLDANGQPFGVAGNLGFTGAAGASAAAMATTLAVVGTRAPAHCEGTGAIGNAPISKTCTAPHVASRGDDTARVAFVDTATGEIAVAALAPGVVDPAVAIYDFGSAPRVAHANGVYCYLWLATGQIHVMIEAPSVRYFTTVGDVPAGEPDAYDVAGGTGFALWGSALYRFDACPLAQ